MNINNSNDILNYCKKDKLSLGELAIKYEMEETGETSEQLMKKMIHNLDVMKNTIYDGYDKPAHSVTGLIGGDGYKLKQYVGNEKSLCGDIIVKAMGRAIACSEVNASMGRIVACPTAGSCGIIPAVIITVGEKLGLSDNDMAMGIFASSIIGILIAQKATMSGAAGGCQAECGSAAAMASAATVSMMGGSIEMSLDAAAIVIKNVLGLVCDPVAGLVEIPCAKRNVAGAINAITTADLVMAGVTSRIPLDDTIEAMGRVGSALPSELRETALGGLATTKKGLELAKRILQT